MKRFVFHYWNGNAGKWYTKAPCKQAAVAKFRELKGDLFIMSVEEVVEDRTQYYKKERIGF